MSTKRRSIEQAVSGIDPTDGFQVSEVIVGKEHSLHLVFNQGGAPIQPMWLGEDEKPTMMLWCQKPMTDRDFGDKTRLKHLVDACCRFINTGGDWDQLDAAINTLRALSRGVRVEPVIPEFHLINTDVNSEGVFEHIYARDDCRYAVRWVEGQFIDVVGLEELVTREEEVDFDGSEPNSGDDGIVGHLPDSGT